jgi:DNA-binding Lrp family transcriptional regulator
MELSAKDRRLVAAIQDGLPLVERPFAAIGRELGLAEAEVIEAIRRLLAAGVVKRFGLVVRHRELGYRAKAMVVFDVPDERVAEAGRRLARLPFVTLCYRRPRRPPAWPYNLFCMIHGRDRATVQAQIAEAVEVAGLQEAGRAVLFSRRCFKQRGARYGSASVPSPAPAEVA